MISFSMFPARDGDCILLQFGQPARRVLVDVGRSSGYRVLGPLLAKAGCIDGIDLFVVSHIDSDHIGGALKLTSDSEMSSKVRSVWFNNYDHVCTALKRTGFEVQGTAQGERLSAAISDAGWISNSGFDQSVVSTTSDLVRIPLHGATLTLLSPTDQKLAMLQPIWQTEVEKAGLTETDKSNDLLPNEIEIFGSPELTVEELAALPELPDRTIANGSSIAFMMEFEGKKVICASDAHPDPLEAAIDKLRGDQARLKIDLLKVSHHGSRSNTTRAFLEMLDCTRFAFSTDGSRHNHPDRETIARILTYCCPGDLKTFYFNYRQPNTRYWDDEDRMEKHKYQCVFSDDIGGYLSINL
ncbi:hypothetical protein GFL92_01020 [Rhizobium leguminosarum bv. viciae]|nr:hypothetical protein [Rhizobium leguminosarum bv. viciae]